MPDSSPVDFLLESAPMTAVLVFAVQRVVLELLERNNLAEHMVLGADFAGRAEVEA